MEDGRGKMGEIRKRGEGRRRGEFYTRHLPSLV